VLPLPALPLVLAPGEEINFTIAFSPTTPGSLETTTIRIVSNDPGAPVVDLAASGIAGVPALELVLPDRGDFGKVCIGSFIDRGVIINNSGPCPLSVTGIASSSPEFVPPGVSFYPLAVGPGDSIEVPIRFEPSSFGAKSATLTVTSSDPNSPKRVRVRGTAPSGHLTVTGNGHFGPIDLGRRAERKISICNTGDCNLHVTKVRFKPVAWAPGCRDCDDCEDPEEQGKHNDQCCGRFKIVSNPFPSTVHPGSCLAVLVRFTPSCAGPQCCELIIESDDPAQPESTVYVTGRLHRTLKSALKCWATEELHELLKAGEECCP